MEGCMSVTWRRLITHAGSTLALIVGCLSLISGIARPSSVLIAGPVIILGALAYRSAKKRKLGEVKSTLMRKAVEVAFLLLICILILAQNNVLNRIVTDPVPNAVIPLWAIIAYLVISLMPARELKRST
jgi:hypothetical protein